MNRFILITLFVLLFKIINAEDIKTSVILQNCNFCHTEESSKSNIIKPLKSLEKEYFLSKMYNYKKQNENSVMNRILEPLNILDIIKMADYLYEE